MGVLDSGPASCVHAPHIAAALVGSWLFAVGTLSSLSFYRTWSRGPVGVALEAEGLRLRSRSGTDTLIQWKDPAIRLRLFFSDLQIGDQPRRVLSVMKPVNLPGTLLTTLGFDAVRQQAASHGLTETVRTIGQGRGMNGQIDLVPVSTASVVAR